MGFAGKHIFGDEMDTVELAVYAPNLALQHKKSDVSDLTTNKQIGSIGWKEEGFVLCNYGHCGRDFIGGKVESWWSSAR